MKLKPLSYAILAASMAAATCANASFENFINDSSLDLKGKANFYKLKGKQDFSFKQVPGSQVNPQLPDVVKVDVSGSSEINMDEFGASLWMDWQSGYLFDVVGFQLGYQAAGPNLRQRGYSDISGTAYQVPTQAGPVDAPINNTSDYGRYYEADTNSNLVGKLGNANIQFRLGDDDNHGMLSVGRFTPTIYNLLHRPDYTYYAMHEVYEGATITGQYEWSWGMIQPWANYFTGYSDAHHTSTINFKDDLKDNKGYGSFDEIYNYGFHTETDYFTSSASYSIAPGYQKNGIIEVYTGIPIGMLTGADSYDRSSIIKFLAKYGMEKGTGASNSDHKTDVTEFGVGLDTGGFDILFGVTQIGKESFRGFETQDGYTAGGGTAVWGDAAVINSFDLANQRTYFVVGGYDLDSAGLPKWRFQGVAAMAKNTDLNKLTLKQKLEGAKKEDYTEINLELLYNYGGEGMSYRFMIGTDTNYNLSGFGLFLEYNTDVLG